ncbi:MAG: protein kinase domain-containing protein [Deltaproteobacteria bacterium]
MRVCPVCQLKYSDEEPRCFVDGAALEELADPRIGTLLAGRYLLEGKLGEGGMAIVYRARHQLVDRAVAIKVMNAHLVRDASLKERFRREAKNAAALAHPNIVEISDYGEAEDGTPYLVMELLEGNSLDVLVDRGPMPASQVASLGAQNARGLARAHDFQVIHRDLKPENIFVARGPGGRMIPKILDFGIARSLHDQRLTSAGQIFGTPQYMAPERVTSIDAGPAADLYALGVMLFEMTTGQLPFHSEDVTGFLIAHMQQPVPKPSELVANVPRRLEELIVRLLAKKPEERPVDAHQVEKELLALAPPEEVAELPVSSLGTTQRHAAPTLPPTTLERWASRAVVFEEMLRRAFPHGQAPPLAVSMLSEIRQTLARTNELRNRGLAEQRKLEEMEQHAREGRQRLGHAMSTLGQDLSQARAAARGAELEVRPYFEAAQQAERAYREAHRKMTALGAMTEADAPHPAHVAVLRETADALDRWLLAHGTSDKARVWVASKAGEVKDLEFQTEALRAQLERLETQYESDRSQLEAYLRQHGRELESLDRRLTELGSGFVLPLRPRPELVDLFARLEHEGATPHAGLPRR